jgi:hypothetical protein
MTNESKRIATAAAIIVTLILGCEAKKKDGEAKPQPVSSAESTSTAPGRRDNGTPAADADAADAKEVSAPPPTPGGADPECAAFCANIPKSSQAYVPQCQACAGVATSTSTDTATAQCASYCNEIPKTSQGYDPQCRACPGATTETAGASEGCAAYCAQIPTGAQQNVPDCVKCGGAGSASETPGDASGCASFCSYVPAANRPSVPACQDCR